MRGESRTRVWREALEYYAEREDGEVARDALAWKRKRRKRYPWLTMEVGDTFVFNRNIKPTNCYSHASWMGKKYGRKFSVTKKEGQVICLRKS